MKLLENKVSIITGATRGIGKGVAELFADQGSHIIFTYVSSDEKARELEAELQAKGVKAKGYKFNVADFTACEEMANDVVKEFGSIDVVVNNAGITRDNLLMRMSEEQWDEVINTNLKSIFNMTKAVQRTMLKQRKGSIVNMSSVVGVKGNAGQANYAASKAGLLGFTKSVALELGSRNIRCNAIAPGFIETDMTDSLPDDQKEALASQIPMGRLGTPNEVAQAVLFLAGESGSYITGQTIHVNGGMYTV